MKRKKKSLTLARMIEIIEFVETLDTKTPFEVEIHPSWYPYLDAKCPGWRENKEK